MHLNFLTKSDFIRFLKCPRYAWLWKRYPELRDENDLFRHQGAEVERAAHSFFTKGKAVKSGEHDAPQETQKLAAKGAPVIYQAAACAGTFFAQADILVRDADGERWHIYEVKSSTGLKEEHLADLWFQSMVFKAAGYPIASVQLILINGGYVYKSKADLEPRKFLRIQNMTAGLEGMEIRWKAQAETALKILTSPEDPKVILLNKSLKSEMPRAMLKAYWKDVPEFGVYRIAHIQRESLLDLLSRGIVEIRDVPDDFFVSERQARQVRVTKKRETFVDSLKLKKELGRILFPLYFLDYETLAPSIPFLDGQKPFEPIPFQFSLHVLETPDAPLKHYDFLHAKKSDPLPSLLKSLKKHIGPQGTILSWNAGFETRCNSFMAQRQPKYRAFLESVNSRAYDLAAFFKDIYVDYRFKGSMSLKNVLPVLAPDLSYNDLPIRNGEMAAAALFELMRAGIFCRRAIARDLKDYCALDTLAMARIYQALIKTFSSP